MKLFLKKNSCALFLISFLLFSICSFAQKTWVGAGAGGAGTDFNTASNWSPVGVPGPADNVVMAITSDATITLSANASINNLTFTVNGNNDNAILSVGSFTLTVNGTTSVDILSGNANTDIQIGVNGGTSAGVIDFVGAVFIGATNSGNGSGFIGNTNSKLIFRNNLTWGVLAFVNISNRPGTFEFDGTGTQTVTWNNATYYCETNNVVIGNTNNPTVNQVTGVTPDNILGNLTINGSSVLNLGTSQWNGGTAGGGTGSAGTLTLNNTSKLQLGAATGGQTGSNFPLRFTSLSIASTSTVEYTGTVAQTVYDIPSPGYGNLTLTNNSTKSPTSGLDIRSDFLINSTATFSAGTALSHSIGGNFTNNNVFTAGTSTITFNGGVLQSISGTTTTTFYNLTANNTAGNITTGITLNSPAIVANTLTLTSGHITTTSTNTLTMNAGSSVGGANFASRISGGSDNSFINGPMVKTGNTDFLFPVGKINAGHRYAGISGLSAGTDSYRTEFMRASATALGSITASGLSHVSNCEYWSINQVSGTSAHITLSWSGNSNCNAAAYVNDLATLVAAHFGTSWDSYGNSGGTTGTVSAGSVTWNSVSTFSPFALGSTSGLTNPLPITLLNLKGYRSGNVNKIEWTNLTESDIALYEIQRSVDGTYYETITTLSAKGNNSQQHDYTAMDEHPLATSFYRIKVTGKNGRTAYSAVVRVSVGNLQELTVYPNPVYGSQFTLQLNQEAGTYQLKIFNMAGRIVKAEVIKHLGGSFSRTVEIPSQLPAGHYIVQLTGNGSDISAKLLKQ